MARTAVASRRHLRAVALYLILLHANRLIDEAQAYIRQVQDPAARRGPSVHRIAEMLGDGQLAGLTR